MADLKISQLTGATTPVAGTEVLPIVQSGATKQISIANLTAGRAVSALSYSAPTITASSVFYVNDGTINYRVIPAAGAAYTGTISNHPVVMQVNNGEVARWGTDGNYVPIAAKGVNFTANTPAAGMTSQLLNAYEEGTWTPNQGSGLSVAGAFRSSGTYTRVGRLVTVTGNVGGTTVGCSAAGVICSNLPFNTNGKAFNGSVGVSNANQSASVVVAALDAYCGTAIVATSSDLGFTVTYEI